MTGGALIVMEVMDAEGGGLSCQMLWYAVSKTRATSTAL